MTKVDLSPRPNRLWRCLNRILQVCCWVGALLPIGVWLTIRIFGESWWPSTVMLYGPRWVYAVPGLVVLPLAAFCRRRAAWLPILGVVVVAGPLMGLQLNAAGGSPAESGERSIRIITCNVGGNQLNWDALLRQVASERCEVVLLQECPDAGQASAFFPPDLWTCRRDGSLFTATRFPMARPFAVTNAEGWRTMAAFYQLTIGDDQIWVANVHLDTPRRGLEALRRGKLGSAGSQLTADAAVRRGESATVRSRINMLEQPVVVAGDFNLVPDSEIFHDNWGDLTDTFDVAGFGYGYSKRTSLWGVRIDHILVSPGIEVRSCHLGTTVGSDHLPLIAELGIARR